MEIEANDITWKTIMGTEMNGRSVEENYRDNYKDEC